MLAKSDETGTGRGQTQPIQLIASDILGIEDLDEMDLEGVRNYYNKMQSKFNANDKMSGLESRYLEALQKYIDLRHELGDMPDPDEI